jgi:hypothetical protein
VATGDRTHVEIAGAGDDRFGHGLNIDVGLFEQALDLADRRRQLPSPCR